MSNSPLFPTDLLSEESEVSMDDLFPRLKLRNISLNRFLRLTLDLFPADGSDAVVTLLNNGEYEKEKLRCSTTCKRGRWARKFGLIVRRWDFKFDISYQRLRSPASRACIPSSSSKSSSPRGASGDVAVSWRSCRAVSATVAAAILK